MFLCSPWCVCPSPHRSQGDFHTSLGLMRALLQEAPHQTLQGLSTVSSPEITTISSATVTSLANKESLSPTFISTSLCICSSLHSQLFPGFLSPSTCPPHTPSPSPPQHVHTHTSMRLHTRAHACWEIPVKPRQALLPMAVFHNGILLSGHLPIFSITNSTRVYQWTRPPSLILSSPDSWEQSEASLCRAPPHRRICSLRQKL